MQDSDDGVSSPQSTTTRMLFEEYIVALTLTSCSLERFADVVAVVILFVYLGLAFISWLSLPFCDRDLTPPNLFLDGEENLKLGDFGLATSKKVRDKIVELQHKVGGTSL